MFIAQPYVQRHICHFAESLGHVLMKLMDRSLYPPFHQLYLPTFRYTREYEWSKAYLQLVRELFPPDIAFPFAITVFLQPRKWSVFVHR